VLHVSIAQNFTWEAPVKTFVLLGVAAILALGFAVSDGQDDLAKTLIGKWEGQVTWRAPGNKDRVLTITSVKDGQATGRFGIPGGASKAVDIAIERSGGDTILRFSSFNNAPTQLTLRGGKTLDGTVTVPSAVGMVDGRLQLDKAR
jgi:hypothetical protein